MPGYCAVKFCKREDGVSMFSPPKAEVQLNKWKQALDGLTKKPLNSNSKVCEKHFDEDCVESLHVLLVGDGVTLTQKRGNKKLKPNSVPFTKYIESKDGPVSKRHHLNNQEAEIQLKENSSLLQMQTFQSDQINELSTSEYFLPCDTEENSTSLQAKYQPSIEKLILVDHNYTTEHHPKIFIKVEKSAVVSTSLSRLKLPSTSWKIMPHPNGTLVLCELIFTRLSVSCQKSVIVDPKKKTLIFQVKENKVNPAHLSTTFESIEMLKHLLKLFDGVALCQGIADEKYHILASQAISSGTFTQGIWHSKRCLHILEEKEASQRDSLPICSPCKPFKYGVLQPKLLCHQKKVSLDDLTKANTPNIALSREELLAKLASLAKDKEMLVKRLKRIRSNETKAGKIRVVKLQTRRKKETSIVTP